MAGFHTNNRSFYLARAALNPPTCICKAIDEWHDRLAAKELSPDDPIEPTVAANVFVQVTMMLRKTFIRNSVLIMELRPCHPIWQHSIFSVVACSLWYVRDLLQIEAQEHDSAHTLLQQCVPMPSGFETPIGYKFIFIAVLLFCSFFPSSILFCLHCHSPYSTTSNERTNER
ncbi:hypothetical protein [Absidia glauca]|uniref:Ndc10 domain-containing protein n=1 Tax=Absidia glauca TaxID=4829 RepID=A0A168LEX4_ABSGL|nr:hypothetical protein [Absidia glauca]